MAMNSDTDFLPKDDLAEFIVEKIVRPQVETLLDRGIRIEARIVYITHNQRKVGPTLGAVKRTIPVQVEICCHSQRPFDGFYVTCFSRLVDSLSHLSQSLEWDLTAEVRRDEKGFYTSMIRVSPHPPSKVQG